MQVVTENVMAVNKDVAYREQLDASDALERLARQAKPMDLSPSSPVLPPRRRATSEESDRKGSTRTARPKTFVSRKQLLLIKDYGSDVRSIRDMLSRPADHAFEIVHVGSPIDAQDALKGQPIDAVLWDLGHDTDRLDAFLETFRQARHLAIVVLSDVDEESVARRAIMHGAQDYLLRREMNGRALNRALRFAIERKQADRVDKDALRDSEQGMRRLVENSADAIILHDLDGRIIDVGGQACQNLGYTRPELLNLSIADIHKKSRPSRLGKLWTKMKPNEPRTWTGYLTRKDRSKFPVEARLNKLGTPEVPLFLAVLRDITDRSNAIEKMKTYHRQLRSLASRLMMAEENERRRLAVDLHDSLGQSLILTKMKLDVIAQSGDSATLNDSIEQVSTIIDEAHRSVRSLTFELSPPILHDLGFVPAAQWLIEDMQKRYGVEVTYEEQEPLGNMDRRLRVILFRAVRELLMNVVKHAKVHQATLSTGRDGGKVQVAVKDCGVGFDTVDLEGGSSFGLFSIRERFEHLGGRMQIQSAVGEGTTVRLDLPISAPKDST